MALSSRRLIDFLEEVDKKLEGKITLVAAGGTAMTLYKLKPSMSISPGRATTLSVSRRR